MTTVAPVGCDRVHANTERCGDDCFYSVLSPETCSGCAHEYATGCEAASGYHDGCGMGRLPVTSTVDIEAIARANGVDPEDLAEALAYLFALTTVERDDCGGFTLYATTRTGRSMGMSPNLMRAVVSARWGENGSPMRRVGVSP